LLTTGIPGLLVFRDRIVSINFLLLGALAKRRVPCAFVRDGALPVLLHMRAIKTSSLTEPQVVGFQDARRLADDSTFDVFIVSASPHVRPFKLARGTRRASLPACCTSATDASRSKG
jgi:hypothetical protein